MIGTLFLSNNSGRHYEVKSQKGAASWLSITEKAEEQLNCFSSGTVSCKQG